MRRALGAILIAGLMFGTAACGSSGGSDSKSSDSSSNSSSDSDSTTSSSNKAVQEYCDAVDAFVKKYKGASASELSTMSDDSKDLTDKAAALATSGLDSDDAKAVADCTEKSTKVLQPGG